MKTTLSKIKLTLVFTACLFLLSSCSFLSMLVGFACMFSDDSDHCFQTSAVQSGDPDRCADIEGKGFNGSNPPRDKCYLQIAENTGDTGVCDRIEGGAMSYTKQECILGVVLKTEEASKCELLKEFPSEYDTCNTKLVSTDKLVDFDEQIKEINSQIYDNYKDGNTELNDELKKKREELEQKQDDIYAALPPSAQSQYFKKKREAMFYDVDDADVQTAIAKEYTKVRGEENITSLSARLEKLKEIKDEQVLIKELDDHANTLYDGIKGSLVDMVEKEKGAILDAAKEEALQALYRNSGEKFKSKLSQLEYLKGKYDAGSAAYNSLNDKYKKLKGTYDELQAINGKLGELDKLAANGKITPDKVRVLKGSVLLGKGLEYATGYVPVFGSTISTVTKETFGVVNKFATKRASRTTALDKCIEDPEHCDPNGISPY